MGMNILLLEDDFVTRIALQKLLSPYGECHIAARGAETVEAFVMALDAGHPYDLICLDILVPDMDGHHVLKAIREAESAKGILSGHGTKIIMTSILGNMQNVMAAYSALCDGYLPKPITKRKLAKALQELKLIPADHIDPAKKSA